MTNVDEQAAGIEPAERGPKRTGQGVLWSILSALLVLAAIVTILGGPIGWLLTLVLAVLAFMTGTKAYGAFTGVKRFRTRTRPRSA